MLQEAAAVEGHVFEAAEVAIVHPHNGSLAEAQTGFRKAAPAAASRVVHAVRHAGEGHVCPRGTDHDVGQPARRYVGLSYGYVNIKPILAIKRMFKPSGRSNGRL